MESASSRFRFRTDRLRSRLAERDLTQEQLARQMGVSLGTVSRWCRGIAEPRGHELVALTVVLGGEVDDWYRVNLNGEV